MKAILVAFLTLVTSILSEPTFEQPQPGIINGKDARKNQFPHQISLQVKDSKGVYRHFCGGSIISKQWIVTAGHCIYSASNFRVVAGIVNLKHEGVVVSIKRSIWHPGYKGGARPNDIGLVELATPLIFSDSVQPIKLPEAGAKVSGEAVVSGWGSTSTTNIANSPDILQTTTLQVLTNQKCVQALRRFRWISYPFARTNICTASYNSNGTCFGDSGGPLIQGNTLVGIVSWGFQPCGMKGIPSVFVKVSSFIRFINKYVH